VRRLVRDGVDVPLARLTHTARVVPPDAEGAARARGATESFLYRRLETMQDTKRHFILNAVLLIAFDGQGRMEIDLLCADVRVAVELDGAASGEPNRVPARPPQGPTAAGARLLCAAVPG
jgi:hypothetical protein